MSQRPEEKRDSSSADRAPLCAFSRLGEGDYQGTLAATCGVAVVLFSAAYCGACRSWKRLLPEALADVAAHFFEVDVGEATGVARYFGIHHLPAIYLYRDGVFHAELQCEARQETINDAVRILLRAPAEDEPG